LPVVTFIDNMAMHPTLTRPEIVAIQRALIAEYEKHEFQESLHSALAAAGENHAKQNKARQELCLPIQCSVIANYGFEPTRKGVMESLSAITDELKVDSEVAANMAKMSSLVERYAGPDEKWATWPTTGKGFCSPTVEAQPHEQSIAPAEVNLSENYVEKMQHELENKLAWAGVDLDSPISFAEPEAHPVLELTLTRQQIINIQDILIQQYQTHEFQDRLHAAVAAAGEDPVAQMHARQAVCLPIQGPVIEKYGFEPSLKGVQQTFGALTDELRADPDIAARIVTMSALVERRDPHADRDRERDAKSCAELQSSQSHSVSKHAAVFVEAADCRLWKVVGGEHHHGLIVRKGADLSSPQLSVGTHEARLSTCAVVREIELIGERLHYKKITGDGPDFGWVSINLHGSALLEPVAGAVSGQEATSGS